jgi:hypothetical protein
VLPCFYLLAAAAVAWVATLRPQERWLPLAAVGALVIWSGLNWASMEKVYQGQWLPKADWRDASAFAASRSSADTRVFSFLNDQFAYGVAYYQPQLEPKGRWVDVSPQGLAGIDLQPDDVVVASSDATLVDPLAQRSFSYRDFPGGIRVYFHRG